MRKILVSLCLIFILCGCDTGMRTKDEIEIEVDDGDYFIGYFTGYKTGHLAAEERVAPKEALNKYKEYLDEKITAEEYWEFVEGK